MSPPDDIADPDRLLDHTGALHSELIEHLADLEIEDCLHSRLVRGSATLAVEHGVSTWLLVNAGQLSSANALLRIQFEATVRALWLLDVPDSAWLERYWKAIQSNPLKDPNVAPGVDKMLSDLERLADPRIAPQLQAFKSSIWNALNSFVHSGIHPITWVHSGYAPTAASGTVRNANGLSIMAAGVIAMLSGNPELTRGISQIQRDFLDCGPPTAA
jgi:hypothetical protein